MKNKLNMKRYFFGLLLGCSLSGAYAQQHQWFYLHDGPQHLDDEAGFSTFAGGTLLLALR
jgi:hypothetical protein